MTTTEAAEWELCTRSLCVQKIPKHLSPVKLNVIFEFFTSKGMTGIRHIEFAKSKRSIFLEFNTPTDAQNALQQFKDNLEWEGEKLVLSKRLYRPSQSSATSPPPNSGDKRAKKFGDKGSSGAGGQSKLGVLDRFPPLPAGSRFYTNDPRPAQLPPGPISRLLGATRAQQAQSSKGPALLSRNQPADPWLQKDNGNFRGYADEPRSGFDLPQLSANFNDALKPAISTYGRSFQQIPTEDEPRQRSFGDFGSMSRDRGEPIRDFDVSLDRSYPRDRNEPMGVERESAWETLYPATGQSRAEDFQGRYGLVGAGPQATGGIMGQQRSPPVVVRDLQSMMEEFPRGNRMSRSRSRSMSPQHKRRYQANNRSRSRSESPETRQRVVISKVNQSYGLLIANRLDKMSEKQQAFAKMKIEEALYSAEFGIFGNVGPTDTSSGSLGGVDQGHPQQARNQSPPASAAMPATRSGQQMLSYLAMQLQQRQLQHQQNQERQQAYGQGQAIDVTQR